MNVGVIGVGLMGLAIALRLRELGHEVHVRDVDTAREALAIGCHVQPSAAQLASACELVFIVVVDASQVRSVLFDADGVLHAHPRPQALVLCPTISAADTEGFAAALQDEGVQCLDAPMSGGPPRARDGSMSLMVACTEAVFRQWQPLLVQLASRLHHVGTRAGDGARTKLVNNLLATINLVGACEVMALAEKLGLDAAMTLAVIEQSSGQSWIGSERLQRVLAGDTSVRAQMSLLAKDSALALAQAREANVSTPLGAVAAARFAAALQAGLADADDSALWRFTAGPAPQSAP